MKVTLRQLEVFDAVATLGSVTAAADRLGMSQSAASSALTDLQIILKRPLFAHARGRPLQITDEGKRLFPMVRSLLSEVQDIERAESAPLEGRLVIGATAMVAETMLPTICVEFMRQHPGVEIRIEADSAAILFDRLSRFELETAVIEIFPDVEGLELIKWRTDELWLVVAPGHELADRGRLTIRDLEGLAWCSREATSNIAGRVRYLLHEQLGQFPVTFESTSNWAVRLAAIAGGGIACLSRTMVDNDVEVGRLVRLDIPEFKLTRALSLARPRSIWRNRLTQAFDRFLLERGDDS
ncbi:MAG TPA: LysR family transcriptional regulator [Sphingobium sp.]|uniref:LysR family transcriptional regulator n=1 Tax=Sphingobium sp. TaxID=1912891 RepID=UPI002ED1AA0B